jgi:transporter family-2 protein
VCKQAGASLPASTGAIALAPMSSSTERPPATVHHPVRIAFAVFAAFIAGVLVAVQSRMNGELGVLLGDGYVAAVISFASGLIVLVVAMLVWKPARNGLRAVIGAVRTGKMPWWYTMSGVGGALFVLGQGLVVGLIGVALFTVGIVAGQTISSALVDRSGLGTMAPKPITWPRLVGAVLTVLGVALAVSGQLRTDAPLWALLAPVVIGLTVGVQQAINGQVREVSGSALTATFVNFVTGTVLLVVILLIHLPFATLPSAADFAGPPWVYLGGLVGIVFIGTQAVVVRITGVLLMALAVLAGQLATAAAFDLIAPLDGQHIMAVTLIGAGITLVAVLIAAIPTRRRASVTSASTESPSR